MLIEPQITIEPTMTALASQFGLLPTTPDEVIGL